MIKVDFGKLQQAIYAFTILRMKLPADIQDDAQFTAKETDQFWNDSFDELYKCITDSSMYFGEVLDALADSVYDTSVAIHRWYTDVWNHPPGYIRPEIRIVEVEDIPETALRKLINDAVPGIIKIAQEMEKERKKQERVKEKEVAEARKGDIPEVVKFVKEKDAASWEYFRKLIARDKHFITELYSIYGSEKAVKQRVLRAKTALGLKRVSAKILKPSDFNRLTLENVYYSKGKLKSPIYSTLDLMLRNKLLFAMVVKELAKS